ncbi:MAG: PD40 domain-containing protein [Planctomycetes bacterium]|nr:PD40 domain-containing protein [Planctomycetota bacterium]
MRRFLLLLAALPAAAQEPGMYRFPCAHGDRVVFTSEGDLWVAPLAGGEARRLTTDPGKEHHPAFSPDGKWIAFTGEYEGNADVYAMPSGGGTPRRLTWNPEADRVIGWTPGGRVLFRARGDLPFGNWLVWSVAPEGGDPERLPLGEAMQVSLEPGGKRCALVMWMWENQHWKRYSGGLAADIWVGDPAAGEFRKLTDWKGNDAYPMWHGEWVYYLTDRNGTQNLWSSRPDGTDLKQHTSHSGWDARYPSLCDGKIAYQLGGDIRVFDIAAGEDRAVEIRLPGDRRQARARRAEPAERVDRFGCAPGGARLAAGARGELFTLPLEEGRILNLTRSPGARDRGAAWSPDGKSIAFLSDATGEYEIWLADPTDAAPPRQLTRDGTGWKMPHVWSPDSKRLAYGNMLGELWLVDAASGAQTKVDRSETWEITTYAWSPDSRFVAYDFPAAAWNSVIRIHDTADGSTHDVTDPRWNSFSPAWDPDGRFLAFLSARTVNPKSGDYMYEYNFAIGDTVKPYLLRLTPGARAAFEPREKGLVAEEEGAKPLQKVEVVWEGILERAVEVPVKAGELKELAYVKGRLVWLSVRNEGWAPEGEDAEEPGEKLSLYAFDLASKKRVRLAKVVEAYAVSPDGGHLVVQQEGGFTRMKSDATAVPSEPGEKYLTEGWTVPVEPAAEWRQIFDEVWRLERDFFYDPNHHKVDWAGAKAKYAALLPRVSSRDELNDLLGEMLAELSNSHAYIGGGDDRATEPVATGSLGARLAPDRGRYRIERILRGDPWNPKACSPLLAAGVKEGEYLLAIDGVAVKAGEGWQRLLVDKADKPVLLTVAATAEGAGARPVYVRTLAGDGKLVYRDWVERNRLYVDGKTKGRVGYVHVPDMGGAGLVEFGRQFFWQSQKDALVIDVRWNSGGNTHGMLLERLRRSTTHFDKPRHFRPEPTYWRSVRGSLVALINHDTASDGENFAHAWRHAGLGPIVGTRTWGGLVGYRGDKDLVDGGFNSQPEYAHFGWDGTWIVEGKGCSPDVEVMNDPAAIASGNDPQLDRAIALALEASEKDPHVPPETPPYEDRSK